MDELTLTLIRSLRAACLREPLDFNQVRDVAARARTSGHGYFVGLIPKELTRLMKAIARNAADIEQPEIDGGTFDSPYFFSDESRMDSTPTTAIFETRQFNRVAELPFKLALRMVISERLAPVVCAMNNLALRDVGELEKHEQLGHAGPSKKASCPALAHRHEGTVPHRRVSVPQ